MKHWGSVLSEEGFLENSAYADAFDLIDRSDFLTDKYKKFSDVDEPVPIPFNQMQSAPHMEAIFVNYGEPKEDQVVLEIGTGSGYLTAILSFLCRRVVTLECIPELSKWAITNISKYGRTNVDLLVGNINRVCLTRKFDLIISTASFNSEPEFLKKLIVPDGRIIFPLGRFPPQRLIRYKNKKREELGSVSFVNIMD
ncbi:MAG: methyltransferase domain-containing protein [Thermoplasmatales archaeon]|nr:methyltransferase domain-containing protein [Candidatus Thermoplasmatota archaeon]MCL6002664.1 methyltransferase domain-containing protein [Candidatus Thermoplasmatota archaeon]MDA8054869.1 methyltransferase domain-containing protein [Thermoplasmatales archaeon]